MLDVLELRVYPDDLEQLRLCQVEPRADCIAAYTVTAVGAIWPVAQWDQASAKQRVNVRGWFALLDQIADEFLLWWPQGGCFFVARDKVTHRLHSRDTAGVMFLQMELHRLKVVPHPLSDVRPANSSPRFASQ